MNLIFLFSPLVQHYLIPLLAPVLHTVVPLLLTLKTLEMVTQQGYPSEKSKHLLIFWTQYWCVQYLLILLGVHDWAKLAAVVLYIANSKVVLIYALKGLHVRVMPYLVEGANKLNKIQKQNVAEKVIKEEDIHSAMKGFIEVLCFNPGEIWGFIRGTNSNPMNDNVVAISQKPDQTHIKVQGEFSSCSDFGDFSLDFYKEVVLGAKGQSCISNFNRPVASSRGPSSLSKIVRTLSLKNVKVKQ